MIKLTKPSRPAHSDGTPSQFDTPEQAIYINPAHIVRVEPATSGGSLVFIGTECLQVLESAQTISHLVPS